MWVVYAFLLLAIALGAWGVVRSKKNHRKSAMPVSPFPAFKTTTSEYPKTLVPQEDRPFWTAEHLTVDQLRGGNAGYNKYDPSLKGGWLGLDLP